VRIAFTVSFSLAFISIFIQQYFIEEEPPKKNPNQISKNPFVSLKIMTPDLKHLLVSDIIIRFCEQIPYAFVVIWCMKNVGVSAVNFGLLTTVEMITAIVVYIPVAWLVEKTGKRKPFVAVTFGFFALFPLMLLFSHSMIALVVAFFIRGLKEFGEPTRKALILHLADEMSKGSAYGAYYLVRDMIVSAGAFVGGVLWMVAPEFNLVAAFICGVLGLFYFIRYCQE